MKLNSKYIIIIISITLLFNTKGISQSNYSVEALTGKGDITFVGGENKLQDEVYIAFKKMRKAALKDGISIEIVSAYRSFKRQNSIWNRKYKANILNGMSPENAIDKIVEYSTLPGTSRHHWGTEIDIIDSFKKQPKDVLSAANYEKEGVYSKLKIWMDKNSEKYGFYLVYDNNPKRKGFKYEPWHYSYKNISKPMLKEFLAIDFVSLLQTNDIAGSDLFLEDFLKKYIFEQVLDINLHLK